MPPKTDPEQPDIYKFYQKIGPGHYRPIPHPKQQIDIFTPQRQKDLWRLLI